MEVNWRNILFDLAKKKFGARMLIMPWRQEYNNDNDTDEYDNDDDDNDDDDNDDDTFDQKWQQHFLGEEQQPRCPPRAKALK